MEKEIFCILYQVENTMKKKTLWIHICAAIIIFVGMGLAAAFSIAYPINLTDQEITNYTEVAENVWYNGMHAVEPDENVVIKYNLSARTVRVSDVEPNKQSITVDFSNSEKSVVVNKPSTSMVGCFFFYGAISVFVAFAIEAVSVNVISQIQDERSKKKGLKNSQE